ncbi:protein CC2D2B homolog [Elephas maximus indicus]|uniref:protein CC2D2B homolog n=1 Tax=Elephas maximus indicus TaxID=99487 RepID=UPI0021165983|nr:protein CC2D2B homolog [Elephas maximus indicus]XP_049711618.1 protein CC2D2B homolog [Elephas maximus indicus]
MSEETDNVAVEEVIDEHLQKATEENQNIIETLRGKVREKLKNAKVNQGEKSSTGLLIDTKIHQWSKAEVSVDEGLSFFLLNGEESSDSQALEQPLEQRLINENCQKHISPGNNLQNFAESQDENFMEEVIYPDLLEIKAAEYEDDQEHTKKQANIFMPSSSPVANQCKLPKDKMPRILEDEGFYVQRKPKIYIKTCNKMENRLLKLEEASAPDNKNTHKVSM